MLTESANSYHQIPYGEAVAIVRDELGIRIDRKEDPYIEGVRLGSREQFRSVFSYVHLGLLSFSWFLRRCSFNIGSNLSVEVFGLFEEGWRVFVSAYGRLGFDIIGKRFSVVHMITCLAFLSEEFIAHITNEDITVHPIRALLIEKMYGGRPSVYVLEETGGSNYTISEIPDGDEINDQIFDEVSYFFIIDTDISDGSLDF